MGRLLRSAGGAGCTGRRATRGPESGPRITLKCGGATNGRPDTRFSGSSFRRSLAGPHASRPPSETADMANRCELRGRRAARGRTPRSYRCRAVRADRRAPEAAIRRARAPAGRGKRSGMTGGPRRPKPARLPGARYRTAPSRGALSHGRTRHGCDIAASGGTMSPRSGRIEIQHRSHGLRFMSGYASHTLASPKRCWIAYASSVDTQKIAASRRATRLAVDSNSPP